MVTVSIVRSWLVVVTLWAVALSVEGAWVAPPVTEIQSNPMPNLGTEGNRYWFFYRQGAGQVGMTQLGAVTVGSPNAKTFQVFGGSFAGPTRCIWGYANGSNSSAGGWAFTPQGGWIATENGEGPAFTFTWSGPGLTSAQATGYDWANSGITPVEIGSGDPVNWDGTTGEPPPTETIQDHQVGFTLTNNGPVEKDYYVTPMNLDGSPIDGWPMEKVTLGPGQSKPFFFRRPGTGTGGTGGAFTVSVIQTDWVEDPEFGVVKQESLTGTWNSVPKVVPINNAVTQPSQNTSGGSSTSSQPPAQQTQVSGEGGITASQANALNQNVLNELQRLGGTVKSAGDTAHTDAQQILGKLSGMANGQNMDGVEGKLDGVKDSVDGVKDAIEALGNVEPGEGGPPMIGPGPPAIPGNGIEEAQNETGILGGMPEKIDLMKGRIGLVVLKFNSAKNALPGGAGAQLLDFTVQTAFGPMHFNFSAYGDTFTVIRFAFLLVMYWNSLWVAIQLIRQALV